MSEPAIRTQALTKHFGAVRALEDLDLTVERGEVFGYLGPNGAGKTTTIRLLLDFLRPTRGGSTVLGGSGADPEIRRRIGYLPAEFAVDRRYTAAELVEFYSALRGRLDRDWLAALYERFELDPTRPVGELSTGNRRKVGIVQAVAHRPDLLILDEPSSGLDPLLQHQFQLLVRELADDGATVFLSSHVLPEVEELATRVAIVRRGQLVTVANVVDLREQARHRIDIRTDGVADVSAFVAIPEVVEAHGDGELIRLVVEGSIDRVVKTAARFDVVRIVTYETDLEDVFLGFYQEDS